MKGILVSEVRGQRRRNVMTALFQAISILYLKIHGELSCRQTLPRRLDPSEGARKGVNPGSSGVTRLREVGLTAIVQTRIIIAQPQLPENCKE